MKRTRYLVKNPSSALLAASMSILAFTQVYSAIHAFNREDYDVFFYLNCGMSILFIFFIILALVRSFRKPTELQFNRGALHLHGESIPAESIKEIMIRGYFKPVVGIKPHGVWIVPLNRCFRFAVNEERGREAVESWAEQNKVKVIHRSFMRWL
ncbi:hypothetical protein [Paenibacillus sp. HB172176]|uniref:hypothetical protein n=1 Tax=Paenibacillus sp. HB172176 TaxID=2493690 RepID=UPI0014396741|nr:hypothetical protein [Paenibacillus sp. HB172176]